MTWLGAVSSPRDYEVKFALSNTEYEQAIDYLLRWNLNIVNIPSIQTLLITIEIIRKIFTLTNWNCKDILHESIINYKSITKIFWMIIFHTVVISRLHFSTNSLILVLIRIPSRGQSIRSVRSLDLPLDRAFSSRWPGDIFVSKGSRYTDIQERARKLTRELAGNVAREVCFVSNEIVSRGRKKERERGRKEGDTFVRWSIYIVEIPSSVSK